MSVSSVLLIKTHMEPDQFQGGKCQSHIIAEGDVDRDHFWKIQSGALIFFLKEGWHYVMEL